MGSFFSKLFGNKEEKKSVDSEEVYKEISALELDGKYMEIVNRIDPYYDHLMSNKDTLLNNVYCFPSVIDEVYYSLIGYMENHPNLKDSEDMYITNILLIYERALYQVCREKSNCKTRFEDVMSLIALLSCDNSEAKVVESDYYCNVVGDKEKGRALLKTALIMTHERGEYGIAGIYRRLGDLFAIDDLEIHKKVAGAFYGLSIFWGDDSIQKICREHAIKYSITILNTKEAVSFLKELNIQVGFSADMQTCAKQIKEVYGDKVRGALGRSIQDIITSAMLIDTMC